MKTIIITDEDIKNFVQIAISYKETLDLIVENSKPIPYVDIAGIEYHYALYERVKHICEKLGG